MKALLLALVILTQSVAPVVIEKVEPHDSPKGTVIYINIEPNPENVWMCVVVTPANDAAMRHCGNIEQLSVVRDFWPNLDAGKYNVQATIQRWDGSKVTDFDSNTVEFEVQ